MPSTHTISLTRARSFLPTQSMSANATNPALFTAADFNGLLQRLADQIPAHCILTRAEDTRPYECDGLSLYRSLPPVVILPENEAQIRSEEHTSELQSRPHLVCRLLLEKKKKKQKKKKIKKKKKNKDKNIIT